MNSNLEFDHFLILIVMFQYLSYVFGLEFEFYEIQYLNGSLLLNFVVNLNYFPIFFYSMSLLHQLNLHLMMLFTQSCSCTKIFYFYSWTIHFNSSTILFDFSTQVTREFTLQSCLNFTNLFFHSLSTRL